MLYSVFLKMSLSISPVQLQDNGIPLRPPAGLSSLREALDDHTRQFLVSYSSFNFAYPFLKSVPSAKYIRHVMRLERLFSNTMYANNSQV